MGNSPYTILNLPPVDDSLSANVLDAWQGFDLDEKPAAPSGDAVEAAQDPVTIELSAAFDETMYAPAPQELTHETGCQCGPCCAQRDGSIDPEEAVAMETGTGNGTAPGTIQELADYLRVGYWNDAGSIPREYNLGTSGFNPKSGVLEYNLSGFSNVFNVTDENGITEPRKELVREAFKLYEAVLGIDFEETTGSDADFFFSDNQSGAYARSGGYGSGMSNTLINIQATWSGGTSTYDDYTLQTVLHEIGHGLGLGHQGLYNGSGTYQTDADFANDSWQGSMMSYFSQTANSYVQADYEFLQTPMSADWLALHDIYGDQSFGGKSYGIQNAFTGDTIYGFNTNITSEVSDIWAQYSTYGSRTASTIIDSGGIDTLDVSGYSGDQRIDLTVTSASDFIPTTMDIGNRKGNLTLATGTVIENANGGSGDDSFVGNEANNIFRGNGGDDVFFDSAGSDTYFGGSGTDRLEFDLSFTSYSFSIVGNFLEVVNAAVTDFVDSTIEWLGFDGELFSFDSLTEEGSIVPQATIDMVNDDIGPLTGALVSGAVTDDASPTLSGTLDAELSAGQSVQVLRDGVSLGTADVDGLTWTLQDGALNSGTYAYTVAVEEDGETGELSSAFTLTIDRDPPEVTVDALVTRDGTPALTGSVNDPDADISVDVNGASYSATNNGDGTWVLADDVIASLDPGSYTVNVTATDAVGNSGSATGTNALTIQPDKAIVEFGNSVVSQSSAGAWTTISFSADIENAVVVVGSTTANGADAAAARIRNVTDKGFEILLQEFVDSDGLLASETVSWVAASAGEHQVGGGTLKAGTTGSNANTSWKAQSLEDAFSATPVVLTQVASDADSAAVITRMRSVNADSFEFQLQEAEADDGVHASEDVNWIAFDTLASEAFEAVRTSKAVTHRDYTANFDQIEDADVVFLANMQSRIGRDASTVRLRDIEDNSASIFIQEERSKDNEINHTKEVVGFVAAAEGIWYA